MTMTESLALQISTAAFSTGSLIAPSLAGRLALRMFSTPFAASSLSQRQKFLVGKAEARLAAMVPVRISHKAGEVQAYFFAAKPDVAPRGTIVLVHGWTSGARFMLAFVNSLARRGFNTVAFDLPAHGKSTGRVTNMSECAAALQAVGAHFGPVHGIVAHSFGAAVTALAVEGAAPMPSRLDVAKIALIASPNAVSFATRSLGKSIGLGSRAQDDFESQLAAQVGRPIDALVGTKIYGKIEKPMLVIHCEDDDEVPFSQGRAYQDIASCQFVAVKGLGHRRILYSWNVVRKVMQFMGE